MFIVLILAMAVMLGAGSAMAATINFDDAPTGTMIDNRYSGVTLGCFNGTVAAWNLCTGHAYAVSTSLPRSFPNVIALGTATYSHRAIDTRWGYFKASFATPVNSVSIDARAILPFEYLGSTTNRPFLQAFNSNGQWLGTAEYRASVYGGTWETLTITRPANDISFVVFSSYNNPGVHPVYGMFDNLQYTRLISRIIIREFYGGYLSMW
ncbi:MAG: hypothetical protein HY758_04420 [Nitrospirae bacterium]|nr:hypothetical protein [Nitrospirota bacterium]